MISSIKNNLLNAKFLNKLAGAGGGHQPKTTSGYMALIQNASPGETVTFTFGGMKLEMQAVKTTGPYNPANPRQFAVGATAEQTVANLAAALNALKQNPSSLNPVERFVLKNAGDITAEGYTLRMDNVRMFGSHFAALNSSASTMVDETQEGEVKYYA